MLKCKIKRGHRSKFRIKGKVGDLATETCLLVNQVYAGIKKNNPDAAEAYRDKTMSCLLDPASPVWTMVPD